MATVPLSAGFRRSFAIVEPTGWSRRRSIIAEGAKRSTNTTTLRPSPHNHCSAVLLALNSTSSETYRLETRPEQAYGTACRRKPRISQHRSSIQNSGGQRCTKEEGGAEAPPVTAQPSAAICASATLRSRAWPGLSTGRLKGFHASPTMCS